MADNPEKSVEKTAAVVDESEAANEDVQLLVEKEETETANETATPVLSRQGSETPVPRVIPRSRNASTGHRKSSMEKHMAGDMWKAQEALEFEQIFSVEKAKNCIHRLRKFDAALFHGRAFGETIGDVEPVSYKYALYGLLGPALGFSYVMLQFNTYRMHNSLEEPQYWYECMLACMVFWCSAWALSYGAVANACHYIPEAIAPISFPKGYSAIWAASAMTMFVHWILAVVITGYASHHKEPITSPWNGAFGGGMGWVAGAACIYYMSGQESRQNEKTYNALFWFTGSLFISLCQTLFYWALATFYVKMTTPIGLAIAGASFGILRMCFIETMQWVYGKIDPSSASIGYVQVVTCHILFIINCISSTEADVGAYAIIAGDWLGIMYETAMVVEIFPEWVTAAPFTTKLAYMWAKFTYSIGCREQQPEAPVVPPLDYIREYRKYSLLFLLTEILEITIVGFYCLTEIMIFNGPNADTINGHSQQRWQYHARDRSSLNPVIGLVIVDTVTLALVGALLAKYGHVNLVQQYLTLCESYGISIVTVTGFTFLNVYCHLAIGCGLDFTFAFDWVL